jgi:hypothetical protein
MPRIPGTRVLPPRPNKATTAAAPAVVANATTPTPTTPAPVPTKEAEHAATIATTPSSPPPTS